jgi:hypothetical protein
MKKGFPALFPGILIFTINHDVIKEYGHHELLNRIPAMTEVAKNSWHKNYSPQVNPDGISITQTLPIAGNCHIL